MRFRISRAKVLHLVRTIENIYRAKILGLDHVFPWFAVYHANYACNASCHFCSQAANINGDVKPLNLSLDQVEQVFRGILPLTRSLYVAGGEPLLEKYIGEMLGMARELGFWPVAVNTNATMLHDDIRPGVLQNADRIVVSMHSSTVKGAARIFGVSETLAARTFQHIIDGSQESKRHGNTMVVNCVLTPLNIATAHGVLEFCQRHGITIAIVPAVEKYWPSIERVQGTPRDDYERFVDLVIDLKRSDPAAVNGSMTYLERIRSLGHMDCRPTSFVTVDPYGGILTPCDYKYKDVLAERLGVITRDRDAREILLRSLGYTDAFAPCDKRCLKACYTQPAVALEDPIGALLDPEYLPFWWLARLAGVG